MHTVNIPAFAGVGFLAVGAMFSIADLALFDTAYALVIGPISWIVGCALMVAWAIGRVGLAVTRGSDVSNEPPSVLRQETAPPKRPAKSEAAAAGFSHTRAVVGQIVVDFIAPLAIWLMLLSFIGVIVLLLGAEPLGAEPA